MIDQNSQFFAILTAVGEAKQANATALGLPWTFSQMGVGDANGTDPIPNRAQTKLINEWRRAPLNQVRPDPANPNIIITEQVIPPDVGGKWIRELALYDADGDMVAVANCAPSFKALLAQGTGKTQIIRMNFIVANAASVVLKIDPAIVLATREYVDTQIVEAMAKMDFKHSVLVATTANIALSGVQTIDGLLLPADARVLVKNQTVAKDNGLYVVSSTGVWKRTQDADASAEVTPGLFVSVETGAVNGDSVWQLVTDGPIVLGTTALAFEMAVGRTGISAGSYGKVTVDKYGRVIAGTNPTTLAGHGITDAMPAGAGGLMDFAPRVAGAISDLQTTQFFAADENAATDMPPGINYAVGLHIKYGGDKGLYALDLVSSVTAEDFRIRYTGAGGPGAYRSLWHSGNFTPDAKADKATTYTKNDVLSLIAQASALPVGSMIGFPVDKVAPGFLELDGSVKSAATYPDLATFLGGAFNRGDEGAGNFRLPESRGEFLRGWDHGRGVDTGRAIGAYQAAAGPVMGIEGRTSSQQGTIAPFNVIVPADGSKTAWLNTGDGASAADVDLKFSLDSSVIRPRNLAVIWCIKAWNAPINQGNIDIAGLAAQLAVVEARPRGVGDGQVWQNVTSSRVSGVVYTNTTGRPIAVSCYANPASTNNLDLVVAGVVVSRNVVNNATSGANSTVSAIIPPGATYSITSTSSPIALWSELR